MIAFNQFNKKLYKMLESLQNDYKQLYSIFSPRTIRKVTKKSNKGGYEVVVYKN